MDYQNIELLINSIVSNKHFAILIGTMLGIVYVLKVENRNIFTITKVSGLFSISILLIGFLLLILFSVEIMFEIESARQGFAVALWMVMAIAQNNIKGFYDKE